MKLNINQKFLLTQLGLPILVALPYYFISVSLFQFALFAGGLYLGVVLLWFDSKFFVDYYAPRVEFGQNNPNQSKQVQAEQTTRLTKSAQVEAKQAAQISQTPTQLATRSFLFLTAYVPLAFFVVTSSGSSLGKGMVLGLGLGLLAEMLWLFRNPIQFNQRFMAKAKKGLTDDEVNWLTIVMAIIMVLLIVLGAS